MKRLTWILSLTVALLWWPLAVGAQDDPSADLPMVVAVHRDAAGAIIFFDEASGQSVTLIAAGEIAPEAPVKARIAPTLDYVAVIVEDVDIATPIPAGSDYITIAELGINNTLHLFRLPSGEKVLQRPLLTDDFTLAADIWLRDAILETSDVMWWSPDGQRLVWIEGTPGTVDANGLPQNGYGRLVAFNPVDESVQELAPVTGMPYGLDWSPTGEFAVFRGITHFGTGAGYNSTGGYLLGPDNTITPLPAIETGRDITQFGWLTDTQYVYAIFSIMAGARGLYVFDAADGTQRELLPLTYELHDRATDIQPDSGQIIATVWMDGSSGSFVEVNTVFWFADVASAPQAIGTAEAAWFVGPDVVYMATFGPQTETTLVISTGETFVENRHGRYLQPTGRGVYLASSADNDALVVMYSPLNVGDVRHELPGLLIGNAKWLSRSVVVSYTRDGEAGQVGSNQIVMANLDGAVRTIPITDGRILDVALGQN